MEKALNFDFGIAGKSQDIFAQEYSQPSSDLDFLEGEDLALDGLNGNDLNPISIDIEYSEAYDTSTSSDIFHVEESGLQENYPLISKSDLDSDSVDELTGEYQGYYTVLDQAKTETVNHLREFSQDNNLEAKLEEAFGEEHNIELAQEILRDIAQEGSLSLPKIEVLSTEEIGGASGAYAESNNTIYISEALLNENENPPGELSQVLLEEFGHYIDDQVNETDTPGDEGAIFANHFNLKPSLSEGELAAISVEDDSSRIIVENQLLWIESSSDFDTYEIQSGDTLSAIAERELGDANRWVEIQKEPGEGGAIFSETEASQLEIGQLVYIPSSIPLNEELDLDSNGEENNHTYTIYTRSFAPPESFGGGFQGDNRGYSVSVDSDVTSRIESEIRIDTDDQVAITQNDVSASSDPSIHNLLPPGFDRTEQPNIVILHENVTHNGNISTIEFKTKYSGKDALLYLGEVGDSFNPAGSLDVYTNLTISDNRDTNRMTINGTLTGDNFPATESFITDPSGQSLFIGTGAPDNIASPIFDLPNGGERPIADISLTITTDDKGNFQNVSDGNNEFNIAEWNTIFESKEISFTDPITDPFNGAILEAREGGEEIVREAAEASDEIGEADGILDTTGEVIEGAAEITRESVEAGIETKDALVMDSVETGVEILKTGVETLLD